jgi:hypothetical protein
MANLTALDRPQANYAQLTRTSPVIGVVVIDEVRIRSVKTTDDALSGDITNMTR